MRLCTLNVFLILPVLLLTSTSYAQKDWISGLSPTYHRADSLYRLRDYRGAINLLNYNLKINNQDSAELIFTSLKKALAYDRMDMFDSAIYLFSEVEPVARSFHDASALASLLLYRGSSYQYSNQLAASSRDISECTQILEQIKPADHYKLAFSYKILVENNFKQHIIDSAYTFINEMNRHARLDTTGRVLPHATNTTAWFFYETGNLKKAISIWQNQIDTDNLDLNSLTGSNSVTVGNLATVYFEIGDFKRAEEYYLALENMHRNAGSTLSYSFYVLLQAQATLYNKIGNFQDALAYSNEGIAILKKLNFKENNLDFIKKIEAKAEAMAGLGQLDSAELLIRKTLSLKGESNQSTSELAATNSKYGNINLLKGDYERALGKYQIALELMKRRSGKNYLNLSYIFERIAHCHSLLDDKDQSLAYLDSAIYYNRRLFTDDGEKYENLVSESLQINLYTSQLDLLIKLRSEEKVITELISDCDNLIDFTRRIVTNDFSKVGLANKFYDLAIEYYASRYFENGEVNNLESAINFTEKSRSYLLHEMISIAEGLNQSLAGNSLLQQRNLIKEKLAVKRNSADGKTLLDLYDQLDLVQKSIDMKVFGTNPWEIKFSMQDLEFLSEKAAFLSYNLTDELLHIFYGQDGKIRAYAQPIDSTFHSFLTNFLASVKDPNTEADGSGSYLSEILIPEDFKLDAGKPILIIPDGILNYLPFEVLTLNDSYLAEHAPTVYNFSLTNFSNNRSGADLSSAKLLSMAPDFNSQSPFGMRESLQALPGATEEIEMISSIFEDRATVGSDGTESYFKQNAGEFSIIHLATHALVDDDHPENSKLVFASKNDSINDGYLHAYELYGMQLNAEMAVLSACNTGFGKLIDGEGVMSLGRAFAYAGCPSIVTSLWPASDKSTPELMKYFYQNLKDGQAKDIALNNARKQYLETATGKARHPFYWGGFVLIGDNRPIESERNAIVWLVPSTIIIVLILAMYRRRRKATTSH